jgi:ABC-2 type transport system permease protein
MKRLVVAACAYKEMLLLWRDPQTLLLLFLMPAVFILVMSLALQDRFEQGGGTVATVLVVDADDSSSAKTVIESLRRNEGFEVAELEAAIDDDALQERIRARDAGFGLRIDAGFEEAVYADGGAPASHVHIRVAPKIDRQREALLLAAVRQGLGQARMEALSDRLAPLVEFDAGGIGAELDVAYLYGGEREGAAPSSVQQNVPAWLVFGIFFVVIPLSNTMIRERQSGTEQRLRTTPAGAGAILAGKLFPYFALNQLQAVAMLLVGLWLVPALGGAALEIAGVPVATLLLMAVAVSVAALGYALLVAALSSTTEQAAMLGGGGNIILAAIGGIMVPEFVMPPALQALTRLSPMAWGLDGFLLAFLERAEPAEVLGYAGALTAFGVAGIALAGWRQGRRSE